MNRSDLKRLSEEDLIELVLRLQRPEKTSRASSKPPSTDQKERRENAKPGGAKPGHEGHSRKLRETSDAFEDHAPTHCQHCGLAFGADAARELIGEYDEIELPPIRPFVRRHRRFSIRCSCCNADTKAKPPAAVVGTPFGANIHALAIYLKETQLFSYERLRRVFADVCGLAVSEGALVYNGVLVTAADGTWGLVPASSNKPELVFVGGESDFGRAHARDLRRGRHDHTRKLRGWA